MQRLPGVKAAAPSLLAATLAAVASMLPRIPQPPQYHQFADWYTCFGLSGCLDISTNALFVLAGLAGLRYLFSASARGAFVDAREALPYRLFFFSAALVGFGSGYYHLAPDNSRLFWDRAASRWR